MPRSRDVQVEPSVIVEVAERRRHGATPQRDARARGGLDEPPEVAAEQVPGDEQVLALVVVVIADRQGHPTLEQAGHAVGERLHAGEPAPRRHVGEPDRRRDRPRVLAGHGHVLIESEDGVTHERAARAPQALETDLVGGGDFHGAMEPVRLSRRLRRATRASEPETALEKPRGLARQLGELPLQRLELPGRVRGGAAREQQVHELEPRGDVRRSAGQHQSQQGLLTLPLARIGRAPGELRERVQRPDVRGIAPEHALDFTARLRLPPGQLVHLGQHQPDVVARRIERGGPVELGFGLAVTAPAQVDEPEVGVPERLVGDEGHDLAELRFGLGKLVLLQVGQAPGPGGEGRVAASHLVRGPLPRRRSPARCH